jgi:HD-GYP domain-containing protein (c-di-GMP phosphodiesterase class II)
MNAPDRSQLEMVQQTVSRLTRSCIIKELRIARALHRRVCAEGLQMLWSVHAGRPISLRPAEELSCEILGSAQRNINALLFLTHLENHYSFTHSLGTAVHVIDFGRELHFSEDELRQAALAGLLHDVGKLMVDQNTLEEPAKLTHEEFAEVRKHSRYGADLLEAAGYHVQAVRHAVRHHHERLDGRGYPAGLRGDSIPLLTRMIAIVDAYDALVRDRPYHRCGADCE